MAYCKIHWNYIINIQEINSIIIETLGFIQIFIILVLLINHKLQKLIHCNINTNKT